MSGFPAPLGRRVLASSQVRDAAGWRRVRVDRPTILLPMQTPTLPAGVQEIEVWYAPVDAFDGEPVGPPPLPQGLHGIPAPRGVCELLEPGLWRVLVFSETALELTFLELSAESPWLRDFLGRTPEAFPQSHFAHVAGTLVSGASILYVGAEELLQARALSVFCNTSPARAILRLRFGANATAARGYPLIGDGETERVFKGAELPTKGLNVFTPPGVTGTVWAQLSHW